LVCRWYGRFRTIRRLRATTRAHGEVSGSRPGASTDRAMEHADRDDEQEDAERRRELPAVE
jgi:hypothetical protein